MIMGAFEIMHHLLGPDNSWIVQHRSWTEKPAYIINTKLSGFLGYYAIRNFFHVINNILGRVWETLSRQYGPIDHSWLSQPLNITLVAENSDLWLNSPWGGLLNFISADQKTLSEVDGVCFSNLIIGRSDVMVRLCIYPVFCGSL